MKRIIIAAVAVIMLIASVFAIGVFAATPTEVASGSCGTNVNWVLDSNGLLTISGSGDMTNYTSSSSNSAPWKTHSASIKNVVVTEGVTTIGDYAFNQHKAIETISLPSSITAIGGNAFSGCIALTSVTISGNNLKSIGTYAFNMCQALTSLSFPEKTTLFSDNKGGKVFYRCEALTLLEIPSGAKFNTGSADSKTGNFANVKADIVFFSDSLYTVTITNSTITCLANATSVSSKSVDNKVFIKTPAGKIYLGTNALEDATSDVTATLSVANNGGVYTYSSSVSALSSGTDVAYHLNFKKGLTANDFTISGATLTNYDSATGVITCNGKLGTDVKVAIEKPSFLGAIPNINEDINLFFTTYIPDFYENPKMTFNFRGNETVVDTPVEKNGKTAFKFSDIRPEFMAETVTATLSAEFDGDTYSSTYQMSLKDYFEWVLSAYDGNDTYSELTDLIKTMIAYGMAAENYFSDKPDNSISELFNEDYVSDSAPSKSNLRYEGEASEIAQFTGVGLRCDSAMAVYYTFTTTDVEGLTLSVTINGRETEYEISELTAANGVYRVDFEGVMATEFGDTITATFKKDGNAIGQSVKYSVSSYVYHVTTENEALMSNANLVALVKAIYAYGIAAENYAK